MAKVGRPASGETSRPVRIPLVGHTLYRDSARSKDAFYKNCFQESTKNDIVEEKKIYLVKRPGLSLSVTTAGTGTARGLAYFAGSTYAVIGDKVYKDTAASIQTLGTSTGPCGFVEYDNAGVSYLFLCDGTDGYSITSAGVITKINQTYSTWAASTNYSVGDKRVPTVANGYYYEVTADAGSSGGSEPTWPTTIGNTVVDSGITWTCAGSYGGFPSPHIPTPVFVDGYLTLAASNSADIYNSDPDNAYGWSTGNFTTAEMWPDHVLALARQNNQMVAFGEYSTEFFYDAATSGTPYARNEAAALQMGIAAPYALYQNEKFCIFIGQSESGGRAAWLIEGFQPKKISTESIERILDAEGTSITTAYGFGVRTKGHLFFVINLTSTTLVYDLEEKVWHEWSSNSNGSHIAFAYNHMADAGNGKSYLLHKSDGKIYTLNPLVYQDNSVAIIVELMTAKQDAGNMNRKFCRNMTLVGDSFSNDTIDVRWTNDDYDTFTNWKSLPLTRPWFARCGEFRRRAFNLKYTGNNPLRLEALELEIDQGSH